MNKFKLSKQISKSNLNQKKTNRIQELHLFNLVQKCTQITKEDRIHLRNKIKQCDSQILNIFKDTKKQSYNMQVLQSNLRKYLIHIKSQMKLERFIKFRQILNQEAQLDKQKKNIQSHKKLIVNTSKKYLIPSSTVKQLKSLNYNTQIKRSNSVSKLNTKLQNTLLNKNLNQRSYSRNEKVRTRTRSASNLLQINKQNQIAQSSAFRKKKDQQFKPKQFFKQIIYNLNSQQIQKKQLKQQVISQNQFQNQINTHPYRSQKQNICQSPIIFSKTEGQSISASKFTQQRQKSDKKSTCFYNNNNNQNLFTSPQLLEQCRKFIQQKSFFNQIKKQIKNQKSQFNQQYIKIQNDTNLVTNIKQIQQERFYDKQKRSSSISVNSILTTQIQFDSDKKINENSNKKQKNIKYNAQQIFQKIFNNKKTQIDSVGYMIRISKHFQQIQIFQNLFIQADSNNQDGKIDIIEFGKILDQCFIHKKNKILQIYSLIDCQKLGFINYSRYDQFWTNLLSTQHNNYSYLRNCSKKLFEDADINKQGKISYWNLYLMKDNKQFMDLIEYFEQFNFFT